MVTDMNLLLKQIVADQDFPFTPSDVPIFRLANIRHLTEVLDDVKNNRNVIAGAPVNPDSLAELRAESSS